MLENGLWDLKVKHSVKVVVDNEDEEEDVEEDLDLEDLDEVLNSSGEVTVTFDEVIAVSDNGLKVGADVANATVTASVVENGKGKKVIVYKYKRKTGYHKKNGHRQAYTAVKIDKINA